MRSLLVVALGLWLAGPAQAGKYNEKLNLGDPAPAWTDLPGVDGKQHSLADLKDQAVVVVIFTCNRCPAASDYEDRILAFSARHVGSAARVAVVAINVNLIPEDSLPKMQERAKAKGFNFPYLFDETQQIARDYGATYTPEFFVLNQSRRVVYMGAMDDKDPPAQPREQFLEAGVQAALSGDRPRVTETLGRGCLIRYAKKRKPSQDK